MTENATKSHSVMPEGLQPNLSIDKQIFNTSSVINNLIQNQMSDELQGLYTILRFCIILILLFFVTSFFLQMFTLKPTKMEQ